MEKNGLRSVVVDVETTGLSVRHYGRVIEVGAVALENGIVIAELDTLIYTGAPISYGAFRVHGISEDMLYGKPEPEEVWTSFLDFAGDASLVAHNAPFDSAFVRHELSLLGLDLPNPWRCTVRPPLNLVVAHSTPIWPPVFAPVCLTE